MRVTVILPVRDGAPWLDAALDSLAAQTRPADEVVAVEDGSTDDSPALLRARSWVTVVAGPRTGITASYAAGLEAATGDAVGFLGQDDLYEPQAIELLAAALEADPGAALAAGRAILFHDGEDFASLRRDRLDQEHQTRLPESVLVRRDALDAIGGIPHEAGKAWDVAMFLKLDELGRGTARVPELVARKRLRADSAIHGTAEINAGMLGALRASILRRRATEEDAS